MAKEILNLVVVNCDDVLVKYEWDNPQAFLQALNSDEEDIPMLDDPIDTVNINENIYTSEDVQDMGWTKVKDLVDYLVSPREINRIVICAEHYNGDTYMGVELSIREDGSVRVKNVLDCSVINVTTEDYLFKTQAKMIRLQAKQPILYEDYQAIQDFYKNTDSLPYE